MTPNRVNWTLWSHQGYISIFLAHGKNYLKCPPKDQEDFAPINQYPTNILGRTDLHSENLFFDFLGFQISRFLDSQIPGFPDSRPSAGMAGSRPEGGVLDGFPRHWTTEFRRSKELGQDRENTMSASPFWEMTVLLA